jgi:hypothetical protein
MKFEIIKDREKLQRKREFLARKYPYSLESFGKVIGYEMPALKPPFPKLASWLEKSLYSRQFWGIEYYVATNNGYIDRIVPAAEYYKLAFRSIADELYSVAFSVDRIDKLQGEINKAYKRTREVMPLSGHSSFKASTYVYALKSELGNFFFVSRSLLDTVTTLMHFLYGPKSRQHRSFTDFIKYICGDKSDVGEEADDRMRDYISKNLEWYSRLKDVRDYITHYKSIDISFYEQPDGSIRIYLEDRFEIGELLHAVQSGISAFINFMDEHFRIRLESFLSQMPKSNH